MVNEVGQLPTPVDCFAGTTYGVCQGTGTTAEDAYFTHLQKQKGRVNPPMSCQYKMRLT